jgi:hypothetical protein
MQSSRLFLGVSLFVALLACQTTVNTLPAPVAPTDPVGYADLEVPAGLEIRSVDFSAATFSDASGPPGGGVSSTFGGRAFVKVYAVHRTSGAQYLLLYEDIARRPRPIQVIRFHAGGASVRPDSAQ